jgi:multiple sugar transport system permease protein
MSLTTSQNTPTRKTLTQRVEARPSYLELPSLVKITIYITLAAGAIVMILPFVWMASTACKPPPELNQIPITLVPQNPSCLENLALLYDRSPEFNRYFVNTIIMTLGRTLGQIVFCSLAAYGFARFRFPGRNILFAMTLGLLMVPYQAILIPQFLLVNELGLRDTMIGLVSPNLFSAFALFLLRQAFMQIPRDLEEAAEIDGASPLRILWSIVIPLSLPAMAAFGVITIQAGWNDFLWPLVITTTENTRPITIGIALLQGERSTPRCR